MSKTPTEVYQAMNASNILVAILQSQKNVSVPLNVFLEASNEDQQLNVEYNEETSSFVFQLKEKIEQPNNQENAEPDSDE
jgi:hypothetical protein